MSRNFVYITCIFLVFVFSCGVSFAAQEKDRQDSSRDTEPSRPILPPINPPSASSVSPTPSPHIASPDIPSQVINTSTTLNPEISEPILHNIPSTPAHVSIPTTPLPIQAQGDLIQVPIIGNTLGRVIDIAMEEEGAAWIEVEDELSGEVTKIKIKNPGVIPVLKEATMMNFSDIKEGDTLSIIFNREGKENIANLIRILTKKNP